jgi:chemotaxis signal transduction protein
MSGSCLLVQVGNRRVGLPLEAVVEVLTPGELERVPAVQSALLGVMNQRGKLIPVFDLATLVGLDVVAAEGDEPALVLAEIDARRVGLMVRSAEVVVSGGRGALAADDTLPWARAIVPLEDGSYVPLLDLAALGARLSEGGT